jgi:ferrous iron transport protein A
VVSPDSARLTNLKLLPLTELPQGISAIVQTVIPLQSYAMRSLARRLAEIGFLPGETVRVLRRVAGGEPIAVRIGGSTFALRKHEAQCIMVRC